MTYNTKSRFGNMTPAAYVSAVSVAVIVAGTASTIAEINSKVVFGNGAPGDVNLIYPAANLWYILQKK